MILKCFLKKQMVFVTQERLRVLFIRSNAKAVIQP